VAAGLDYVGVSPILSNLKQTGRVRFESATDQEVLDAFELTVKQEGLIPALESAHAFACAFQEVRQMSPSDIVIINQSGRGDKDIFTVADAFGDPKWKQFIRQKAGADHA
jgi:tryptophan synthase beta chain